VKRAVVAVAFSVAAHAGLGLWLAMHRAVVRPIVASGVEKVGIQIWEPGPPAAVEGKRPEPPRPVRRMSSVGAPPRASAPVVAVDMASGGTEPVAVVATPVEPEEAGGPIAAAAGGAGSGAPPVDLAALHRKLADSARRCYPAAAARFRLQGDVSLTFCVDGSGSIASLALQGSTGAPLLDRAALDCVVQGALPLPVSTGCYQVPVRFSR
jgi:TonB family protein